MTFLAALRASIIITFFIVLLGALWLMLLSDNQTTVLLGWLGTSVLIVIALYKGIKS